MEILNFEKAEPGKYELATFDLDFGEKWGFGICRLKLCRSKQGHFYFQASSYKKSETGSKDDWKGYFYTYGEKGKDFSKTVMDLLEPHIESLNGGIKEVDF